MIVSNSVALIYLTKIGSEDILTKIFTTIYIAETVYTEVVEKGKEKGYLDAYRIEELSFIRVASLDAVHSKLAKKLEARGLEKGEAETISLAKQMDLEAILDEKKARNAAELMGVSYCGTLAVLIRGLKQRKITQTETKKLVDKIIKAGFRVSSEGLTDFSGILV